MPPAASFARAAVRPFASPLSSPFVLKAAARQPTTTTLVRRITTARPAARASPASAASSKTAIPRFSAASFLAATFRRANNKYRGRRFQSGAAGAGAAAGAQESWFKRMWDSPIGLKTVHFWAPVMKWALVIAGISDFARPVEKLSVTQNAALTATGLIWTRWCLIIKPKNYLLAAVNFFLGIVGVIQCTRIFLARGTSSAPTAEDVKAALVEGGSGGVSTASASSSHASVAPAVKE